MNPAVFMYIDLAPCPIAQRIIKALTGCLPSFIPSPPWHYTVVLMTML